MDLINLIGKDRLFPLFTTDVGKPSLVYNYTLVINDYVSQTQLEIKIIWNDYDEVKEIENKLKEILAMKSDSPFITYKGITFKSSLSGGGILFREDLQMYEDSLIFIIKWKKGENKNG
ncbi:hypothetical protein [Clostridium sp. Marseille-Q2269]|uniref:hypothetical protein n=1 Tax=Clostridium sp. Marseille-Q2269 TaxID=2942205 RepID=UPI002074217A|nr:hypothetical protein [Clostridium sp. Marseille-Q2269]